MNRGYHATTAKYNILYNGQLAYDKGVEEIKEQRTDNFAKILPVEMMQPDEVEEIVNTEKNPNFQRAEEKAIKAAQNHSIYIAGTENNPQIDDAYLLLGKARYHDLRYVPAQEAFNYIVMKYPDSDIFYDASIWVEKTNLRLQYDNTAIRNLKKLIANPEVVGETKGEAYATLAQGYINTEAYDSAKTALENAYELTKEKLKKARYTYILGQLNSKLGQNAEAIQKFDEVIAYNYSIPRAYVINAYGEKFANQDKSQMDTAVFVKEYGKLLRDRENRAYLDMIYHQLGLMYETHNDIDKAVKNFNNSLRRFKDNNYVKQANYEHLAEIYYGGKDYEKAGMYYDSTMVLMNPNTRDYLRIKRKRNGLIDVVNFEQLVRKNDSILNLAQMSDEERLIVFNEYVEKLKKDDEERARALAEASRQSSGGGASIGRGSNFYFYSPNSVNSGKQSFASNWGNRPNVDNWRWENEAVEMPAFEDVNDDETQVAEEETEETVDQRYNPEFYIAQIPTDEAQLKLLKKDLDNAYYQLGVIYYERLNEYGLAAERLEKLLSIEPDERLIEPAKYHLYKIYGVIDAEKAAALLEDMKLNHPNSQYTQVILNPNATLEAVEEPVSDYEEIYQTYTQGDYTAVLDELDEKIPMMLNDQMLPKYELLRAVTVGKLEGLAGYKAALNHVALTYPSSKEGKEAERILNEDLSRLENMNFKMDLSKNLKFIYEVSYPIEGEDLELKEKLERYAQDRAHTGIKFSVDQYSDTQVFLVLHGIKSGNIAQSAQMYLEIEQLYQITRDPVLISTEDYVVVLIKKNWDEYLRARYPQEEGQQQEEQPEEQPEQAQTQSVAQQLNATSPAQQPETPVVEQQPEEVGQQQPMRSVRQPESQVQGESQSVRRPARQIQTRQVERQPLQQTRREPVQVRNQNSDD